MQFKDAYLVSSSRRIQILRSIYSLNQPPAKNIYERQKRQRMLLLPQKTKDEPQAPFSSKKASPWIQLQTFRTLKILRILQPHFANSWRASLHLPGLPYYLQLISNLKNTLPLHQFKTWAISYLNPKAKRGQTKIRRKWSNPWKRQNKK